MNLNQLETEAKQRFIEAAKHVHEWNYNRDVGTISRGAFSFYPGASYFLIQTKECARIYADAPVEHAMLKVVDFFAEQETKRIDKERAEKLKKILEEEYAARVSNKSKSPNLLRRLLSRIGL